MKSELKPIIGIECHVSLNTKTKLFCSCSNSDTDLAKDYQITQYEIPIGSKGYLELPNSKINITRIQIEEDPAALIHKGSTVLIDYNRSGTPLCEIVTEPEITSAEEAREF